MIDGPSDRGQSTTLEYALTLAVATLVLTSLFMVGGSFISNNREEVVQTELEVVGQRLVSDVVAADRLNQSSVDGTQTVAINSSLPRDVTGKTYNIEVAQAAGTNWVNMTTKNPDVTVSIRLETETDLDTRTLDGGPVSIVYDEADDELEVRS